MRSLGVRLAIWYGAAIALLLLLLGGFLYIALDRYLTGQALTLLRAQATPLQRLVAEQQPRGLVDVRQIITQIVERPAATGVGVFVVGPNARLLGQSQSAASLALPEEVVAELRGLTRGRSEDSAIVKANGQRYQLLLRPLSVGNQRLALVLATSLAPVDATLHSFVLILLMGVGSTLLIAGAVVVLITRLGLRPLRDIAAQYRRLGEGNFGQRMKVDESTTEVHQLQESFNEMAEKLETAWQGQRQFAADASHELRTPLTSLAGYIDVLDKGAKNDPATRDHILKTMRGEVDRMAGLVRDLVSLARLDAGDQLKLQRLDVTGLVEDVYEQTKAMAPDREVHLRAGGGAWANIDVERMRQVLLNLADNAIKYTPPQAEINFAVQTHDSTVQISVADNGPGIAPQDREHVFDRFYRADQSRTRESGGAGLGLAIAKKIVEAHRGSIAVSSPPEGGAVFTVRLPAAA
jgi:two-component system OmpR family sensor kinase